MKELRYARCALVALEVSNVLCHGGAQKKRQLSKTSGFKHLQPTEVVDVEEADDARQQQLQLTLDDGALILAH